MILLVRNKNYGGMVVYPSLSSPVIYDKILTPHAFDDKKWLKGMVSGGAWCNGSTADFGSVYSGSNPDAPA